MNTTIPTFDSFAADEDLDILNKEQKAALLSTIHAYMASAGRIAVSDDYLMVEGGNLDYYAGLEYSDDRVAFETTCFKVWRISGVKPSRCNAASIAYRARNILAGKPPYGNDEDDDYE